LDSKTSTRIFELARDQQEELEEPEDDDEEDDAQPAFNAPRMNLGEDDDDEEMDDDNEFELDAEEELVRAILLCSVHFF
jgi:essential nuclear protein 1